MPNIANFDTGILFSAAGKATGNLVQGYDEPTEYTPQRNPKYILPKWNTDVVMWLRYSHEPLYLWGPTGAGKTSAVKETLARIQYPVFEVTGHARMEFSDMVGHHVIGKDGSMTFQYGPLSMAMKTGGAFLLNEMDLLDPGVCAGLNSILDGAPLCIAENGGEVIKPHPMFKFIATANTSGSGDMTGMYQATVRQNMALMDRFMVIQCDYLPQDVETRLVKSHCPNLPDDTINILTTFANAVRSLFMGKPIDGVDDAAQIEVTMSTRTLLRWAEFCLVYEPMKTQHVNVLEYALDRALTFRASATTRTKLQEILQRFSGAKGA